jgi:hypothetical protein
MLHRTLVPPFGAKYQWLIIGLPIMVLFVLWTYIAYFYHVWDWLLISGWATMIVAILRAGQIPYSMEDCVGRLVNRQVLRMSKEVFNGFKEDLENVCVQKSAIWVGCTLALGIVVSFLLAFDVGQLKTRVYLLIGEVAGGYVAGCYLGRMMCYGRLGRVLKSRGFQLHVVPGHEDATGGVKPVGDFFFSQSKIAGLPAIFLAVWLILISFDVWPGVDQYKNWERPYAGLLVLAIAFEIMAFVWPLWEFHLQMRAQKRVFLEEADALSVEIAAIRASLARGVDEGIRKKAKDTLSDKLERYKAIEELPVWPFDLKTKRKFAIKNFLLFLPAIGQYTGLSQESAQLLRNLAGVISG